MINNESSTLTIGHINTFGGDTVSKLPTYQERESTKVRPDLGAPFGELLCELWDIIASVKKDIKTQLAFYCRQNINEFYPEKDTIRTYLKSLEDCPDILSLTEIAGNRQARLVERLLRKAGYRSIFLLPAFRIPLIPPEQAEDTFLYNIVASKIETEWIKSYETKHQVPEISFLAPIIYGRGKMSQIIRKLFMGKKVDVKKDFLEQEVLDGQIGVYRLLEGEFKDMTFAAGHLSLRDDDEKQRLLSKIASESDIVVADFNHDCADIQAFQELDLADHGREAEWPRGILNIIPYIRKLLDGVFVNPKTLEIVESSVVPGTPSDHPLIMVKIKKRELEEGVQAPDNESQLAN